MLGTTRMWIAAMNVGSSQDEDLIHEGNISECIMALIKWLGPKSMGKRFDVIIARSELEAKQGFVVKRGKAFDPETMGDLGDALDKILNGDSTA